MEDAIMEDAIKCMPLGEDYYAMSIRLIEVDLLEVLSEVKSEFETMLKEDGAHPLFRGTEFEARVTDLTGIELESGDDIPPEKVIDSMNPRFSEVGTTQYGWVSILNVNDDENSDEDVALCLSREEHNCGAWFVNHLVVRLGYWEAMIRTLRATNFISEVDAENLRWAIE